MRGASSVCRTLTIFLSCFFCVGGCGEERPSADGGADSDMDMDSRSDADEAADSDMDMDSRSDADEAADSDQAGDGDAHDADRPTCPPGLPRTVATTSGCVQGIATSEGEAFLGIPYAEPPLGELRWRRPLPLTPRDTLLEASSVGPFWVQAMDDFFTGEGFGSGQEDCLTINVFRPAERAEPLPILFFTHGGGLASGSGGWDIHADAPKLAASALLITYNYRLGAFGFMAHPEMTAEDPEGSGGNLGFFDALLALRWVRDNAAAFGGDPEKILVFGESGGGRMTNLLLAAPHTAGLFSAAMIQSAPRLRETSLTDSEAFGLEVQESLGCADLACMREASAPEINDVSAASVVGDGHDYVPTIDGVVLVDSWEGVIATGRFHHVPAVFGANADEAWPFAEGWDLTTEQQLQGMLRVYGRALGISDLDSLVGLYTTAEHGGLNEAFNAFYGDAFQVCPTRNLVRAASQHTDVRQYHWARHMAARPHWRAFHSAELFFLFGTYPELLTPEEEALGVVARQAWTSVAAGEPAVAGVGPWPLSTADEDRWMVFDLQPSVATSIREQACDFLTAQGWATFD